jgi:hypothetical protein
MSPSGQKCPKRLRLPAGKNTHSTWAGSCQEETLDGTRAGISEQSVGSPLSGVKPPGSVRTRASAHDPLQTSDRRAARWPVVPLSYHSLPAIVILRYSILDIAFAGWACHERQGVHQLPSR